MLLSIVTIMLQRIVIVMPLLLFSIFIAIVVIVTFFTFSITFVFTTSVAKQQPGLAPRGLTVMSCSNDSTATALAILLLLLTL